MNIETLKLGGTQAWLMWIIATTFVLFLFNLQTGYNIINPSFEKELSISVAKIGFIASTYTVVFALFQLFSGSILDRFGVRYVIPIAIAMVALGALILAKASSYEMLLLSQVVMAIGAAFGFVGAGFVGGEWFGGAKYGFMFGLVQSAASFGSLFGGNILNSLLMSFDWREIIHYFAYFGFLLALISLIFMRDNKKMGTNTETSLIVEIFT